MDADLSPRFNDSGSFGAGPPPRSEVEDDWTFRIVGVHGTRRLRLTNPPAGWMLKGIYLNGADVTDETFSFESDDRRVEQLEVVLTNQMTALEGFVTDSQGRPARSCLVVAFRADGDPGSYPSRFMDRSVCERDGSFIIRRLPPAGYYVTAIVRQPNEGNDEWQSPQMLAALASRATRIVLGDGQNVSLTLRLR